MRNQNIASPWWSLTALSALFAATIPSDSASAEIPSATEIAHVLRGSKDQVHSIHFEKEHESSGQQPKRYICEYWEVDGKMRGVMRMFAAVQKDGKVQFPEMPQILDDSLCVGSTSHHMFESRRSGGKVDREDLIEPRDPTKTFFVHANPWVFSGLLLNHDKEIWLAEMFEPPNSPSLDWIAGQEKKILRATFSVDAVDFEVDLDPALNFSVVRMVYYYDGTLGARNYSETRMEGFREVARGLFFPMAKRTRSFERSADGTPVEVGAGIHRVTKLVVNAPIDPSVFERKYAEGTRVVDKAAGSYVVWGKDGPVGEPTPIESRMDPGPWPLLAWVTGGAAVVLVGLGGYVLMRRRSA